MSRDLQLKGVQKAAPVLGKGVASKYLQTWNIYYPPEIIFLLEPAEEENLNLYFIVDLNADMEEREKASWTT